MSDSHLRELERRWRQTGTVEDEAAWLLERLRVVDLKLPHLSLAAFLGHQGARIVLDDEFPEPTNDLLRMIQRIGLYYGRMCTVRAALPAVQSCIHLWHSQYPHDRHPQQALEAVSEWILCPCKEHSQAAQQAAEAIPTTNIEDITPLHDHPNESDANAAAAVATAASYAATAASGRWYRGKDAAEFVFLAHIIHSGQVVPTAHIRQAICNDLIPWALGYSDPVRERCTRRNPELVEGQRPGVEARQNERTD